jgi:hypothetical protein
MTSRTDATHLAAAVANNIVAMDKEHASVERDLNSVLAGVLAHGVLLDAGLRRP